MNDVNRYYYFHPECFKTQSGISYEEYVASELLLHPKRVMFRLYYVHKQRWDDFMGR